MTRGRSDISNDVEGGRVPVLRIIARLNVGGPSIQAITLTRLLEARGYDTTLIRGREAPDEGAMDYLADELAVRPLRIRSLKRELGLHDAWALLCIAMEILRRRPEVLHTHAAKAGTLGRAAALMTGPFRPRVRVHTFHGHVLTDYFSARSARLFAAIERFLAKRTTRLIAVSEEVRADLIRLGIASGDRIEVIPVGFDLSVFEATPDRRADLRRSFRSELGVPVDAPVVTLVSRLVPIKRVDRFLRIAERLLDVPGVRFLIVGDGELRQELRRSAEARRLGDRVVWAGFRRDMAPVYHASDIVTLTSDNEGTPVTLIEAQAAGVPVVSTRVGGTPAVVADGVNGRLLATADEGGFADAVRALLDDPATASEMGAAGRSSATERFTIDRLVDDVDRLYRRLLGDVR